MVILTNNICFIVILYNFKINRPPLSSILTWILFRIYKVKIIFLKYSAHLLDNLL